MRRWLARVFGGAEVARLRAVVDSLRAERDAVRADAAEWREMAWRAVSRPAEVVDPTALAHANAVVDEQNRYSVEQEQRTAAARVVVAGILNDAKSGGMVPDAGEPEPLRVFNERTRRWNRMR